MDAGSRGAPAAVVGWIAPSTRLGGTDRTLAGYEAPRSETAVPRMTLEAARTTASDQHIRMQPSPTSPWHYAVKDSAAVAGVTANIRITSFYIRLGE
jgi:hypothetical protein